MSFYVAVLRGGPSSEHEVSLKSGATVLKHLPPHFKRRDIYIDKSGTWHVDGMPKDPHKALAHCDVVFNALHGEWGEDGKVQQLLEHLRVPYTGSGVVASAIGMAKQYAKERFAAHGLRIARSALVTPEDDPQEVAAAILSDFGLPVVVKPASSGSSVGVRIVKTITDLPDAISNARATSPYVLLEEYIKGKEATCGVVQDLRGHELYALPPIEIVMADNQFFDYDAKYGGGTQEICPGRFSESEKQLMQTMAEEAHRSIGARHYSRSDFIIHPTRGIYILEINTLPGMTDQSLIPQSLEAIGVSLPLFLEHVITLAVNGK